MPKSGFSLPEILMVTAILIILAGFLLPKINSFNKQSELDAGVQNIISALRLAQNKTLASEGADSFGVHFEENRVVLFKGTLYNPASPDNNIFNLGQSIIVAADLSNGASTSSDVVFERLTGEASYFGNARISSAGDPSTQKIVYIGRQGAISLAEIIPDDTQRIKDSRHIHIMFNQNTQSASTLSLSFPSDSQTININYQDYLNAAKDEFDWSEAIEIGGESQKIRIHTHNIDGISTLFCADRDRRYNFKAVSISLDGHNLINYSADGALTAGSSAWAEEPEIQ